MRKELRALLRTDFNAFVQKAFETVSPGDAFHPNWHIEAIDHQLERCRNGENRRLVITQPPRSLKSICASVAFVAWLLGHDPTLEIVCVSYSEPLAKEFTRQFRMVVESAWYKEVFPNTRVESATALSWRTTAGGGRFATTVGGPLTGFGADFIIIDDPMKAEDAHSEAARDNVNRWFGSTLSSRFNDQSRGVLIMVMQRLHEDDLAGHVLEMGGWHHLDLPAIAVERQEIEIAPGEFHVREVGELLHPERHPQEVLDALRQMMGSLAFSAQYQQRPVPAEGNLIRRDWFRYYDQPPPEGQIVQSWDIATTTTEKNDYSVCTTWLVHRKDRYLIDVWRGRLSYPALKRKVIAHAREHGAHTILVEKAGPGLHMAQELREVPGIGAVIPVQPKGDKLQRMEAQSAQIEAGHVYLPKDAPWSGDLLNELLAFPKSKFDDQVDSVSQFLGWISLRQRDETISIGPPELFVGDTDYLSHYGPNWYDTSPVFGADYGEDAGW